MATTRICENCNTEYPARSRGKRFCSMSCRAIRQGEEETARKQTEYSADPNVCPCGTAIPYEKRHTNKHCSPACVSKYQPRKQLNPDNYITFNCLTCDDEVTRYKKYGNGASKYCSNKCAMKHTKVKKHFAVDGFEIVFDSSYEAAFWGMAMIAKIPIERFDRSQSVEWKIGQWYGPDFYLPTLKTYVECKGFEDDEDQERWQAFRNAGYPLVVMNQYRMANLSAVALYDTVRICAANDNLWWDQRSAMMSTRV